MPSIYNIKNYPHKDKLEMMLSSDLPVFNWRLNFDIFKDCINTDDPFKTTVQYVNFEDGKLISKSNVRSENFLIDAEDSDIPAEFFMFQIKLVCPYEDLIPEQVKTIYSCYIRQLKTIPDLKEAFIHIVAPGKAVLEHIDQEHFPEAVETERANIVINLTQPAGAYLTIDNQKIYAVDQQFIAFNAQYKHSACNNSKEDWVLLVLHIPTKDLSE